MAIRTQIKALHVFICFAVFIARMVALYLLFVTPVHLLRREGHPVHT